ncbi:MAG TPA: hypothetical protein VLI71_08325 [Gammaproteobacteria bacterium]|nr:hypothetical protein [Gammaproteobacteria bacterium]
MSNYVKLATEAGDQYLASLAEIQENFLKATTAFAARFTPATPVMPLPAFAAPEFPTAQEITEATFAFSQKLLKQQKTFAEKLLAVSTPAAK